MVPVFLWGCSDDDPSGGPSGSPDDTPTETSVTSDSTSKPATEQQLGVADADLVLPEDMFAGFWTGFEVVSDVGGDGADDIVGISREVLPQFYEDSSRTGLVMWPDVLDAVPSWTVKSPTFYLSDGAKHEGVRGFGSVPDVTGDGSADMWVSDSEHLTHVLPGPLTKPIRDPAVRGVATLFWQYVERTTDLDHDGAGELLMPLYHDSIGGNDVGSCEGPFAGEIDVDACDRLVVPMWETLRIHGDADVDGDGIDDLLVSAYGYSQNPEKGGFPFTGVGSLLVFDGASLDGTPDPLLTIVPTDTLYFSDPGRTALADLDGDGRGDVAWVESPDTYGDTDGEVAVLHGPLVAGTEYELTDATLHLDGLGADALIAGVAADGDGAWLVFDHRPVSLEGPETQLTPFLVDGALRGTTDPWDTAWFLASDGPAETPEGWKNSEAHVADFDGDDLGDVLVVDTLGPNAWIYLGASLPPRR